MMLYKNVLLARKLYLLGYGSDYLVERTGLSMMDLHRVLKTEAMDVKRKDIIEYQKRYLSEHYSYKELCDGYRSILLNYDHPDRLKSSHQIMVLGCCFGQYAKVFRSLLGVKQFSKIRNECWKQKQVNTVKNKYGVSNVFEKSAFHKFVSDEAVANGRKKRIQTLLDRYGVDSPNANPEIAAKMLARFKQTNRKKYGVDFPLQNMDVARKASQKRMKTMLSKYGFANSVQVPSIRKKIFDSRLANNQFISSAPEEALYQCLLSLFGTNDICRNYDKDLRYPYHVDFYIKSQDLFIEFNGDASHGDHWFNSKNMNDKNRLHELLKKAHHSHRYRSMINVWSVSDVKKRQAAKHNHLKYLVIWEYKEHFVNKQKVFDFPEFDKWVADGMPAPSEFKLKHCTY